MLRNDPEHTLLLMTGSALTEEALALAEQIAGKTGCKVMGQTYHPRMARGQGRFSIDRIPYVIEQALPILKNFKHIVLVEANDPVAFFAYPNKPSMLKPEGCEVHRMTSWGENSVAALEALAGALGAKPADVKPQKLMELAKPTGALTHASIAQAIAMAIPENAIIVDESITTGRGFFPPTAAAAPHDWLQNMGGSIGFSTPVATGAAVACPDRKVICMVGDGSAMYTIQSLWTQARENLNVLTIVFANRIYQILRGEFDGVGAGEPGQRAMDMLKIDGPTIDFVALAKGMGVPAAFGRQCRRFRQGAGGRRRRKGTAADRSADVSCATRCAIVVGEAACRPRVQAELDKVVGALGEFYARETHLLEKDLGERALTHRLAVHLESRFAGWDVDCDYNRLGERRLRLPKGSIVSTDDDIGKVGLSRYRRAPPNGPGKPAGDRSPQSGQPPAAGA